MNVIAKAPQGLTRPPRRAVRALALVAFLILGSVRSFAADQVVSLDSYQWNKLSSDTGNIETHTLRAEEHLNDIKGSASTLAARQLQIYNLLYQHFPLVKSAIEANGFRIDTTNDKLQSIVEALNNERVSILSNIETYNYSMADNLQQISQDFRRVIADGAAPSVRVSFDPRVAVTNKVEFSSDFTNALAHIFNSSTNRQPYQSSFGQPGTSKYYATWTRGNMLSNYLHGRDFTTVSFDSSSWSTGDFYSDSISRLSMLCYVLNSVSRSSYVLVTQLDGVTNRLEVMQHDLYGFHSANTNLLASIKDQDKTHYESFEELKTAILRWMDDQDAESQAAKDQADEALAEVEGYRPESGEAGDQSFDGEDLSSRISDFDGLVSVLADRQCPQSLVIRFGGWSLFGAEVSDDPIVIPLTGVQSVLDFLRMGFSLLWWGLSFLVMWWLVRLVVQLQHKIVTWTFTTTTGPQS